MGAADSQVDSEIQIPDDQDWMDKDLCKTIGEQMMRSGWVSSVDRVAKKTDGTILISCQYRRPVVMVQIDGMYVAADQKGHRLPGLYPDVNGAGWIRLVGVGSQEPVVGKRFTADDALAGIELAALLAQQSFAERIDAVDVSNLEGRLRPGGYHIRVLTRGETVFNWGSPIGEEFDENSVEQKLRLMHRQFVAGLPRGEIDLTVYPNAVIEREGEVARGTDGLARRGGV